MTFFLLHVEKVNDKLMTITHYLSMDTEMSQRPFSDLSLQDFKREEPIQ